MTDEIPIGPNRCPSCWGEYGQHTLTCKLRTANIQLPQRNELEVLREDDVRLRQLVGQLNADASKLLSECFHYQERITALEAAAGKLLRALSNDDEIDVLYEELANLLPDYDAEAGIISETQEHRLMKHAGSWQGDDFEDCLVAVEGIPVYGELKSSCCNEDVRQCFVCCKCDCVCELADTIHSKEKE